MDQIEKDILYWYNKAVYSRLGSDVSVTELLQPVQISHLRSRYKHLTSVTSMDNIVPSLAGNGLHDQLQRYLRNESLVSGKWQIERNVLGVINNYRVKGRFDALYNNEVLYDIKTTRAWKFLNGDFTEWEQQLNIYDYLLFKDGITLKELKIMGVVLDWQAGKVWDKKYPSSRIQIVKVDQWSRTQQEGFLSDKVNFWSQYLSVADKKLPLCSTTERWGSKPVYKLFRTKSSKRATKVFPSNQRAGAYLNACYLKDKDKWKDARIDMSVDNQWNRCESWCEVAPHCHQYKNKIEV